MDDGKERHVGFYNLSLPQMCRNLRMKEYKNCSIKKLYEGQAISLVSSPLSKKET